MILNVEELVIVSRDIMIGQTVQAGLQTKPRTVFWGKGSLKRFSFLTGARPSRNGRGVRPLIRWNVAHHLSRSSSVENVAMVRPFLLVSTQQRP